MTKLSNHPLQSKEWGNFRKAWGNEILWTDYGLLILHKIPLSKTLTGREWKVATFIKGPEPTRKMLADLKKIGKEKNFVFIKIEPYIPFNENVKKFARPAKQRDKFIKLFKKNGCFEGKTLFTPTTFWVDLTKSEDDLLKSFSSKTRYNIRLAERKGVKVSEDNSDTAFKKYIDLTFETTRRQGFYAHTPHYHKLMWEHLHKHPVSKGKEPVAHLMTATFKKEIVTTWILFRDKNFLYYPYGASTEKHKEVMANNLMMWEAIKFGKKLGLSVFDLWGREEGKGFTKFKEGYNPEVIEFLGSWDLVINKPLYFVYRNAERARWTLLRLKAKFFHKQNG